MGNPTAPVLHTYQEPVYNVFDLISLAFRLSRKTVLGLAEICDMSLRLNPHLQQDHIYQELTSNTQFVSCHNGWKMVTSGMPSEAKKRRVDPHAATTTCPNTTPKATHAK